MGKLFNFTNGWKSYVGFIGMFLVPVIYNFIPDLASMISLEVAVGFFQTLAGVGIAHKLAKGSGD